MTRLSDGVKIETFGHDKKLSISRFQYRLFLPVRMCKNKIPQLDKIGGGRGRENFSLDHLFIPKMVKMEFVKNA